MKKVICILSAVILLACAFCAGRQAGIQHAIEDSVIFTVDIYCPDDPDQSAWNGYDQLIYIDLDGSVYEHGMYQG